MKWQVWYLEYTTTEAQEDMDQSTPKSTAQFKEGQSYWYRGGRAQDRKWTRPCPKGFQTVILMDSQGRSFL